MPPHTAYHTSMLNSSIRVQKLWPYGTGFRLDSVGNKAL